MEWIYIQGKKDHEKKIYRKYAYLYDHKPYI
jgi:hypothetical protein